MLNCLEFVKNGRLIDGVFTVTLLGSLNIIKMGNRMNRINEILSIVAIVLILMIAGTIDAEEENTQLITQGE